MIYNNLFPKRARISTTRPTIVISPFSTTPSKSSKTFPRLSDIHDPQLLATAIVSSIAWVVVFIITCGIFLASYVVF